MPPKEPPPLKPGVDADGEELLFFSDQLVTFSNLGRTMDGSGIAYRTANCADKRIGVVKGIENYVHLNHLDLSSNSIKDISYLKNLKNLLKLNLSSNCVANLKSLDPGEEGDEVFPSLTHLLLDRNSITELRPLPFKSLKVVSFQNNEIVSCEEFGGHESIESLNLSSNKIKTLAGIANLPSLQKLDVSHNAIEDINGLGELPSLVELNLSDNRMQGMEGPWQELGNSALTKLDLSRNMMETPKPLEVLRSIPKLKHLLIAGNPFMEAEDAILEVLLCHWLLATIDGEDVSKELFDRAGSLNVRRLEEAREAAKAEEEAAAA
mmetsp:Transcript_35282/g.75168  ORF Transcript_35282/g.75168 Transcript_35282/m.75168 type:complete len:322 (+) Transcript_35282:114-1079(+)